MFMPRVNLERKAAWYKDGEPDAMSPVDAQVGLGAGSGGTARERAEGAEGGTADLTWKVRLVCGCACPRH